MITLINSNRMTPPIGPIGLDYLGGYLQQHGVEVELVDLCLADDPDAAITSYFKVNQPDLVGISCRNNDDCFWPSATWFSPRVKELVVGLRKLTDAPIVLGGVGFSAFAEPMVRFTGADFGIRGDGEQAMTALAKKASYKDIAGLIWRNGDTVIANRPGWDGPLQIPTGRDFVDNAAYFEKGGQCGFETKRGCPRQCSYCADPVAKGHDVRLRDPDEIADEIGNLLGQGIDVLHTCDAEFNIPYDHAVGVCEAIISRMLHEKIRWYAYCEIVPFDQQLAELMRRAGCVGIDFTADSADPTMLTAYAKHHTPDDLARAVRLCRENGITVMFDLLLGGPGETVGTAKTTIDFVKRINPDCIGAGLGMRIYPGTGAAKAIASEGPMEVNAGVYRKYSGSVDLFRPTFYISPGLGDRPDQVIHDLIGGDSRFFPPIMFTVEKTHQPQASLEAATRSGVKTWTNEFVHATQTPGTAGLLEDHNYNDNQGLVQAIAQGQRGAYWDILRKFKNVDRSANGD